MTQTTKAFGQEDGMSDCKEYEYVSDNSGDDFTHSVVKGDGAVHLGHGVVGAIWFCRTIVVQTRQALGK